MILKKEHICEETGEEVILVKDKKGKVIGFEKLNFLLHPKGIIKTIPVEVLQYFVKKCLNLIVLSSLRCVAAI